MIKILIYFLLIIILPLYASSIEELTIERALEIGLSKNKSVLTEKKELDIAKAQLMQARSGFMPMVGLNSSYNMLEKVRAIEIPAGSFMDDPVLGPVPAEATKSEFDFTYDYSVGLSITQPLYAGGQITSSYRQARLNYSLAEEKFRQAKNETAFLIKTDFYNVLLAKELIKVAEEALSLAQEYLRFTKVKYDSGESSELDLLRAEVEVANIKPEVIKAENQYKLAILALKNVLGIALYEEINIYGEFEILDFDMAEDKCIELAMKNRPDLKQIKINKEIGEYQIKTSKAGYYPNLSLVGNYDLQSNELNDVWIESYAGYLMVSVPIFEGFSTKGKIQEAKGRLKQVSIGQELLEDGIKLDVIQTFSNVIEAREIISASKENVKQAEKSVEIAQEQYRLGTLTSLEIMDVQLALTKARTNYLQSLYEFIISVAELKKAMGEM